MKTRRVSPSGKAVNDNGAVVSGAPRVIARVRPGLKDFVEGPGEFRWVPKEQLCIDHGYQRQAINRKAKSIASSWSWVACGAITVADRQGKYYVIDGGHRVLAAGMLDDISLIPCMIFRTRTLVEEAKGFIVTNKHRKAVTAIETFRALCVTGDETALGVRDLLDGSGIRISKEGKSSGTIKCVRAMLRCYQANPAVLRAIWPLIIEVSRGACIKERVAVSLFYIESRLQGTTTSLLRSPWRDRVVRLGWKGIFDAASKAAAFYNAGGSVVTWSRGVVVALNKGVQNRLDVGLDRD